MKPIPDSLLGASAASQFEILTRRQWKQALITARLLDLTWTDLVSMDVASAWKWLGWDAAKHRVWNTCLDRARNQLDLVRSDSISVISELDASVPAWLQKLETVPWVFARGDHAILDRLTIGFSGQREAGETSLGITAALSSQAAKDGYTVVSGGARGIDMAAHTAVLEAGGQTAVILPQGLATWSPPAPLTGASVLAISEDVPWELWNTESAMRRNRMIVELSDIFTVPQSGTSGGSHSTGMFALKHHVVTWVPDLGPDFPGNRKLLQRGARLLEFDGYPDLEAMRSASIPPPKPEQPRLF